MIRTRRPAFSVAKGVYSRQTRLHYTLTGSTMIEAFNLESTPTAKSKSVSWRITALFLHSSSPNRTLVIVFFQSSHPNPPPHPSNPKAPIYNSCRSPELLSTSVEGWSVHYTRKGLASLAPGVLSAVFPPSPTSTLRCTTNGTCVFMNGWMEFGSMWLTGTCSILSNVGSFRVVGQSVSFLL